MATPPFSMMVFTSAKSTLTSPGFVMSSVIPLTERIRTRSQILNASWSGRFGA